MQEMKKLMLLLDILIKTNLQMEVPKRRKIRKVKYLYMNKLFCLLLLITCTNAFNQSINDSVVIGKIEKFYKNTDSISLFMENKSCQKIYIQISL
jgi:hypothetical protein